MRAKQFCVLTTTESTQKFGTSKIHLSPPPPGSLGGCLFLGGGSVVVGQFFWCASHWLWQFCICLCLVVHYFVSFLVLQ